MRRLPSFLFLALISLHFYHSFSQVTCPAGQFLVQTTNECVNLCPTATYISTQGTQQTCAPQRAITPSVRPIPEENSILVMFNDAQLPFLDPTDAVQVSMVQPDGTLVDLNAVSTFLNADTLKTVFAAPPTYKETNLMISFTDYTAIRTSPSYITGPVVFPYMVFASPNDDNPIVVEHLTKLDRGLEWAWIAVTTLNPYAFLYMNTKLYRETLEVFKRTNVKFGRDASNFFQQNNNKVSGYKAANMFPILLMDDPVTSGWNREEENALPTAGMNQKRFNDLRLPSTDSVYTYDTYALFLDNYGSQITVFFGFATLIIIFEFLNIALCCSRRRANPSKIRRLFQAIRTFLRWNILIACIIGSFQTLMYYFMVQMQTKDLAPTDENNNLSLNFWFAIGTFIILCIFFPILLALKLRAIYRRKTIDKQPVENDKFWGIFTNVLNFEKKSSIFFIFALMLRTPIFAALTVFLNYNPIAQVSVMLAFSVIFAVAFMVLRPFKRLFHTIFQLVNELVLIAFLCVLIFLAQQVEKDIVDDNEAVSTGAVLIAFWMLVPTLGIVFGIIDIMMRLFRRRKQKETTAAKYSAVELAQSQGMQIESTQKTEEKGEYTPEAEQLNKVGATVTVENTEPIPIMLPVTTENPDAEALQTSQDSIEGKKGNGLHIEATPSRRAFPNLSYIEGIDTIVEEVDKEQASANLKDEGNKRRVKDNTLNISMAKSIYAEQNEPVMKPKEVEPERRENMRMLNPMSNYGPSLMASRNVTETEANRTQDKIKAAPLSLDMPMNMSLRTSRIQDSERRPKSIIFGNSNGFTNSNGFQSNTKFLPMDALNRSDMTNRSLTNMDAVPVARIRPMNDEGYKNVNKRLIFE